MKTFGLVLLLVVSVAFIAASYVPKVREYRSLPLEKLIAEIEGHEQRIAALKQEILMSDRPDVGAELSVHVKAVPALQREIFVKRYRIESFAWFFAFLSFILLVWSRAKRVFSGRSVTRDEVLKDLAIDEAPPKEMYTDEWEFQQRTEGAFKTRKEAIEWLKTDPTLKCDYCGSRLRSTMTGKRESVQLVTFYKKVPEGAKDLRMVLGTFWITNAATELKCPGCGKLVKR